METPEQPTLQTTIEETSVEKIEPQPTTTESFWDSRLAHLGQSYLTKAITIILIIQGLRALYNSISFIFIEMPQLEQQLALIHISQEQINTLANKAIIMTISTILSLFFALKITMIQSKVARGFSIILAILLIFGNTQINNLLSQIGSAGLLTTIIIDNIKSILSF